MRQKIWAKFMNRLISRELLLRRRLSPSLSPRRSGRSALPSSAWVYLQTSSATGQNTPWRQQAQGYQRDLGVFSDSQVRQQPCVMIVSASASAFREFRPGSPAGAVPVFRLLIKDHVLFICVNVLGLHHACFHGNERIHGIAEGISYLVVVATVAYSLYVKVSTGKGLPAGPSGLLGAVEGLSYLALVGGLAAFGVSVGLRS